MLRHLGKLTIAAIILISIFFYFASLVPEFPDPFLEFLCQKVP